jgi:RNA polymerase sigma factor (sigma-70 family)
MPLPHTPLGCSVTGHSPSESAVVRDEDQRDYESLFRAAYPRVVRTVFVIVHDRGRAEEISQDAFVQLLGHWKAVSQYERPEAWVRRVAVRLAVRRAHRENVRGILERRVTSPPEEVLPDIDLARAVAVLAPMQRAAIVLYYLEDRPIKEISEILQVSESTVKQHLYRARSRLAVELGEEVTDDVPRRPPS